MQKIWKFRELDGHKHKAFAAELGVSPILAQILLNRGISDPDQARTFLRCDMKDCHDPFLLKDMSKSVSRVQKAIKYKEKIVIYGDYDVDGVTSCAVLFYVLSDLGADVSCYIPHRIEQGYGLNLESCQTLKEQGVSLVITVDCGVSGFQEIEYLKEAGVDVIITDHHQPLERGVPDALCVINPWQKKCSYPYKELAGVGLAYKLALGVSAGTLDISEHLDLVALGTICDVAPLTGENRILVKHGLERLSNTKKEGLRALKDIAKIRAKKLSTHHVGFMFGPRLNAMGRMGSAEKSLELLLSTDYAQAYKLAQILDQENRTRQKTEQKILKEALSMVESQINFKHHRTVVLHNDAWHPGVIGIVASRIAERFYRPTILISTQEGIGKGSGRSIRDFHLFDNLSKCNHLLEGFGGHANAAGISILEENLADFKQAFNDLASHDLTPEKLQPIVDVDMEVTLSALSEKLINDLEKCAPFGIGNSRPVFASQDLKLKQRPKILRGETFKLWLTDEKITCEAIGRLNGVAPTSLNEGFSIVYSPSINDWQGISTIQLQLKDIRLA
ncbi:MAG: single-stranded-DNA-specific exonuclease RecJ [PVC group bacterium]|nr:single-stranded-DNA-specific exonuclease RecJ [PVC group bacterium]